MNWDYLKHLSILNHYHQHTKKDNVVSLTLLYVLQTFNVIACKSGNQSSKNKLPGLFYNCSSRFGNHY